MDKQPIYAFRGAEVLVHEDLHLDAVAAEQDWCRLPATSLPEDRITDSFMLHLPNLPGYTAPIRAVRLAADAELPPGLRWLPLREAINQLPEEAWFGAARALAYLNWHSANRFCGRCGQPMQDHATECALACPACGQLVFPRLSPAVLAVVYRGDKLLLARNANNTRGFWSLLAGFVEPGERFEDCVRREVTEEVGIEVEVGGYLGSQPWPFPDQLMIGFEAYWTKGELRPDGSEIAEAGWFSPDSLPPIPASGSLSRRLIDQACKRLRTKSNTLI